MNNKMMKPLFRKRLFLAVNGFMVEKAWIMPQTERDLLYLYWPMDPENSEVKLRKSWNWISMTIKLGLALFLLRRRERGCDFCQQSFKHESFEAIAPGFQIIYLHSSWLVGFRRMGSFFLLPDPFRQINMEEPFTCCNYDSGEKSGHDEREIRSVYQPHP